MLRWWIFRCAALYCQQHEEVVVKIFISISITFIYRFTTTDNNACDKLALLWRFCSFCSFWQMLGCWPTFFKSWCLPSYYCSYPEPTGPWLVLCKTQIRLSGLKGTVSRDFLPPVSVVLLIPVANCHRYQRHRRQICHRCQRAAEPPLDWCHLFSPDPDLGPDPSPGSAVCRWFRFAQLAKGKKFRP